MNKPLIYVLFLLFLSNNLFSKTLFVEKKLVWNDSVVPASCTDAVFFEKSGSIPFFSDVIEIPVNSDISFSIAKLTTSSYYFQSNSENEYKMISFKPDVSYEIEQSGKVFLLKYWFPLVIKDKISGQLKKIDAINININLGEKSSLKADGVSSLTNNQNSKLSSGVWLQFEVVKDGIYKITGKELARLGYSASKSVRVFGFKKFDNEDFNSPTIIDDIQECSIFVSDGNDGHFDNDDYILFYGEAADKWYYNDAKQFYEHLNNYYSNSNYYYVLIDGGTSKQINSVSDNSVYDYNVTSFNNADYYEYDESNVLSSGREWFENLPVENVSFSFNAIDSSTAVVKTRLLNQSSEKYNAVLYVNNKPNTSLPFSQNTSESDFVSNNFYTSISSVDKSFTIGITANTTTASKTYLDYIVVNIKSPLIFSQNTFRFRSIDAFKKAKSPKYYISTTKDIIVWNITNTQSPINITLTKESNGYSFVYSSDTIEEFIVFSKNTNLFPSFKKQINNQNLHGLTDVDMVIVTANNYKEQATELQKLHEKLDGIKSVVLTQDVIFNEFSGGRVAPFAIRNFLRYLYEKENKRLKFLLILGDGSYDNKKLNQNTSVLTYQSLNSINEIYSYVSDDYFCILDAKEGIGKNDLPQGAIDIASGRLPVSTVDEANVIVNKIIGYTTDAKCRGDWRNRLLFLADDGDEDQLFHMTDASALADKCIAANPNMVVDKVFLDAYPQESIAGGQRYPTVNKEIESKVKRGCLVFNFTGHGNPLRLTSEIVVDKSEVDKWENKYELPVFVTAGCQIGRFDDKNRKSLGEEILLSNHGGGIALFTTTRSVFAAENRTLNSYLFDYMFAVQDNKPPFLGEVARKAKNKATSDLRNKYYFTLLGDPALRIAMPMYKVITDSVDGVSINDAIDTLKALSTVTIQGHIADELGNPVNSYNGAIQSVVLDKPQTVRTLSNDGFGSVVFKVQNNILFSGKANVQNGKFQFKFIVPRDIFYYYGKGRISYYADNGEHDGAGSSEQITVGGSTDNVLTGKTGPVLKLYLNDTTFVDGGVTNQSPLLIASVSDEYGINVSGTSVGHDATALFDGMSSEQVVLNHFYEANQNSYQKGMFKYPISTLSEGNHSVMVKVWNINNQKTEATLDFVVETSASMALNHVLNYPNPFTTNTTFFFEHNQNNQKLDVLIQIYTISGRLIKTIHDSFYAEGNRSNSIVWDGRDDYGDNIGRGVYIYRISVKNESNKEAHKTEKLVVLK